MKHVIVQGRRWFQKTYGNTYNTVRIIVDGESLDPLPMEYGYGDFYLQRAADELDRRGLMPGREHYATGGGEALWRYCERHGITFTNIVADVPRQRDL